MKPKYFYQLSLVCGLSLCSISSCKDNAEPVATTATAETTKDTNLVTVSDKEAELGYVRADTSNKKGSIEQLAKNAGFAQYLPSDSEMYVSYIGVESMMTKLRGTKLAQLFEEQMEKEEDVDLDRVLQNDDYLEFMNVAGEEVFFASGKGSSSMLASFMKVTLEVNKWQFKMMLSEFSPDFMLGMGGKAAMIPSFFKKKDGVLQMLKETKMAPMYVGFKVSDKTKRDKFIAEITAEFNKLINLSDMRMMKVAESKEANGFYGFEWSGKGFLQMLGDERREELLAKILGQDLLDSYKEEIAKKSLTCMVGNVGDYVVFYVGKDAKSLKLETSVANSLLSNPEMSFARNHADKELASLMYISGSMMKTLKELDGRLKPYTGIFSDVLEQTDAFGDTRKLRDLLEKVEDKEQELYDMMPTQRVGIVASHEEGFKIDMYMGKRCSSLDLNTPRDLTKMVNHPDAAIYGSWIRADDYTDKIVSDLEAVWNVAYEVAKVASQVQHDEPEWVEFQNNFKLFDKHFAGDLLRVWESLTGDFAEGIGSEFAMIMDLKGMMPSVPIVPSVILKNGQIPRFTVIKPVVDRKKISNAWDEINVTSIDITKTLEQITGEKMEMLKPERVKKFGLDTWSYQLGVTSKDANLAIALNNDLWFMTTSPTGLEDLTLRAYSKGSKQAKPGAEMVIRLDPMRAYARHWMKLMEEHGQDIDEDNYNDFMESKPMIEKFLKASEDLELIDSYTRKEDGEVQSTLHFKMRK